MNLTILNFGETLSIMEMSINAQMINEEGRATDPGSALPGGVGDDTAKFSICIDIEIERASLEGWCGSCITDALGELVLILGIVFGQLVIFCSVLAV